MHLTASWRRSIVGACAAALVLPLALSAGSASAAPSVPTAPVPVRAQVVKAALPAGVTNVRVDPVDPAHPTQRQLYFNSTAMGRVMHVTLLVPPGYTPSGSYPEVYLLDGLRAPQTSSDWINLGGAEGFFKDKNVLAVLSVGGGGSFFQDWKNNDPGMLAADGTPNTNLKWQTFLTGELPGVIGTLGGNGSRAVAGLSMGGFSAFNLATINPGLYKAAASYSGFPATQAFLLPEFLQYVLTGESGATNADNMWGPPSDPLWTDNNPLAQITKLEGKSLYMSAGTGLPGPFDNQLGFFGLSDNYVGAILEVVSNYSSQSFAQQAAVTPNLAVTTDLMHPGTHGWAYWAQQLRTSWPQLANAIGATGANGCTIGGAIAGLYYDANVPNQLGPCVTNEMPVSGRAGVVVQQFANGHIYYTFPGAGRTEGANFVQGVIDQRYQKAGGPGSFLGMPISNEYGLANGAFSRFEGGSIYWTPGGAPQVVKGAIYNAWGIQKYEVGPLGYPTSEEFPITPNGRVVQQNFQGGNITYNFDTGVATIH